MNLSKSTYSIPYIHCIHCIAYSTYMSRSMQDKADQWRHHQSKFKPKQVKKHSSKMQYKGRIKMKFRHQFKNRQLRKNILDPPWVPEAPLTAPSALFHWGNHLQVEDTNSDSISLKWLEFLESECVTIVDIGHLRMISSKGIWRISIKLFSLHEMVQISIF